MNDRLSKLQAKHNAEVELLEDLKLFTRQRSLLEKQYAEVSPCPHSATQCCDVWECAPVATSQFHSIPTQNLHRLVSQYISKREILPPPTVPGFERHENRLTTDSNFSLT